MGPPLTGATVAGSLPRASPLSAAACGHSPRGALTGTVFQRTKAVDPFGSAASVVTGTACVQSPWDDGAFGKVVLGEDHFVAVDGWEVIAGDLWDGEHEFEEQAGVGSVEGAQGDPRPGAERVVDVAVPSAELVEIVGEGAAWIASDRLPRRPSDHRT